MLRNAQASSVPLHHHWSLDCMQHTVIKLTCCGIDSDRQLCSFCLATKSYQLLNVILINKGIIVAVPTDNARNVIKCHWWWVFFILLVWAIAITKLEKLACYQVGEYVWDACTVYETTEAVCANFFIHINASKQ